MSENNKKTIHVVNQILTYVALIVFSALMVYNFLRAGGMEIYDTIKGRFYWQGIFFLGCALFISYGVRLKSYLMYPITLVYYVASLIILLKTGYKQNSPELWSWYIRIAFAFGTVIPILVDAIMQKRIRKLPAKRIILLALFSTPVLYSIIYHDSFSWEEVALLVMTWVILLVEFHTESLKRLVVCLAGGRSLGIMSLLIKCLIKVPYKGEYHYIGLFHDSPIFAAFMGTGVVLCLVLYLIFSDKYPRKKTVFLIATILCSIPYIFMAVVANGRNTFVALMFSFLLFFFILTVKTGKKKYFLTLCIAMGIVAVLAIVLVVFLTLTMKDERFAWLMEIPQLDQLQSLQVRLANTKSHFGVFPEGHWLNRVDYLLSWRLSVWTITARQLKLFQGNPTAIPITDTLSWPTHNTYLGFLNKYGIVMGTCCVAGIIWSLIIAVKKAVRSFKDKKLDYMAIIAAFWMLYFASIYLNESFYVVSYPSIIWLLLLALPEEDTGKLTQKVSNDRI